MNASFALEAELSLCVQISIVVLATLGLQRCLGDVRAACRLWTLCFISILALTAAAFLLPHRRLFPFPASISGDAMLEMIIWQSRLVTAVTFVWLLGVGLSLMRRGYRCVRLLILLDRHCESLSEEEVASLPLDRDGEAMGLIAGDRRLSGLRMMVCERIRGPFCWQLHLPVVVLPRDLIKADRTTLRHVLLHELEHLRTRHPMQHFLQGLCSVLFWFHPAVWCGARRAELAREFLCDEVAAIAEGSVAGYLRTILSIAERSGVGACEDAPAGTLAFGNRRSVLVRRSERLVKLAQQPPTIRKSRRVVALFTLITITVLASTLWLPVNATASPRSDWSPWPSWTATVLHDLNISVRDFEPFDERARVHELLQRDD